MTGAGALYGVRRQVADMPAVEAVEYLLDLLADALGDQSVPEGDCQELRLSPSEIVVFRRLYRSIGTMVTRGALMNALYIDRPDPPGEDTLRLFILRLRRKLPAGFAIESVWSRGYRLTRAEGARFSWET